MADASGTLSRTTTEAAAPNALYRFFSKDDQLLYIGITKDLGTRLKTHNRDKTWFRDVAYVRIQHFNSRAEVLAAEIDAIKAEKPLWNVKFNRPEPDPLPVDAEVGLAATDGPTHLRTDQAASMLNVSNSTVIAYAKAGLMRVTRTAGRHRRYAPESVTELSEVLALPDGLREPAMQELRARNRGTS